MHVIEVPAQHRFSGVKFQKVNLFDSPRMFCDIYCFEPGQEQALHSHADNDKVYKAITPAVETCEFGQVVCVKAANTPGTLNEIAHKLAGAGVGIDLVYAAAGDAGEATIVLRTTDNDKAAKII